MTEHLAAVLAKFGGQFARTRCFLHITNLTARSLLNEFDVKGSDALATADADEQELLAFAKELEDEVREAQRDAGDEVEPNDDDGALEDDDESWVDEVASLSSEELEAFKEEVRPVKMMLLKVREVGSDVAQNRVSHTVDRSGVLRSK